MNTLKASSCQRGRMTCVAAARHAGVTLIELMVVLCILGFAMFAMLPGVKNWANGLSVRNSGESIKGGLERARMESLRRNTSVSFWMVNESTGKTLTNACEVSSSGTSWVVSGASPHLKCGAAPSPTADPRLVAKWASSDGANSVSVSALDAQGNAADHVTFNSLGQIAVVQAPATPSAVRIDIAHSSGEARALRIVIDAGGAIRMCDPAVGVNDPRSC